VDTAVLDELKQADASTLAGTPLFNGGFDEGKHQEARLSPSLVYNTVDNPNRPRRGLRLTGSADVALPILGGTLEYLRPEAEAVVFLPHTARTALGVRAQMGWLFSRQPASELPYYRRYFLGGEYELRGTELRSVGPLDDAGRAVGGTRSVLFNAEYYLDIGPVRALAFHDAGQAFAESQPLTLRRLRTSSGVEARFTMPMLNIPVRVIYAWNFYRDSFQPDRTLKFGIGTTF
jgi:outer membrane protein insertion porin family